MEGEKTFETSEKLRGSARDRAIDRTFFLCLSGREENGLEWRNEEEYQSLCQARAKCQTDSKTDQFCSIGRFAPPVQAGKHASWTANQIEAPCPAGTISAPPLGGRFPVRAPKIMFSGLSPLDLPLSGVLGIHAHTFPGFPLFHGYSPGLYALERKRKGLEN